jgi:hypothetical protein
MNHSVESCPEQLQLIETGDMPRIETAILRDRLARGSEQRPSLADVNAYKHRLHALRCENFSLRLQVHNLETQLNQMRATRGWKLLEKIRWWRRTTLGWLQRQAGPRP